MLTMPPGIVKAWVLSACPTYAAERERRSIDTGYRFYLADADEGAGDAEQAEHGGWPGSVCADDTSMR